MFLFFAHLLTLLYTGTIGASVIVIDPNSSYFEVKKKINNFQKQKHSFYNGDNEMACSALRDVKPMTKKIDIPSFYTARTENKLARKPLVMFENYLSEHAAKYVMTGSEKFANCVILTLKEWAVSNALYDFEYSESGSKQSWFEVSWTVTSSAMAYSIVRSAKTITNEDRASIEGWLNKLVRKIISYPGGPVSCCNNLANWRGLAASIVGIVSSDDELFNYGIESYKNAIQSLNLDGSFYFETGKESRVVHYQNFAILPLVYIAEIASRQNIDLYSYTIDKKNLKLAIKFLEEAIHNPQVVTKYTNEKQDLEFLDDGRSLNWVEPYLLRSKNQKIEKLIRGRRPIHHRYAGGYSTLFFYPYLSTGSRSINSK